MRKRSVDKNQKELLILDEIIEKMIQAKEILSQVDNRNYNTTWWTIEVHISNVISQSEKFKEYKIMLEKEPWMKCLENSFNK